MVLVPSPKYFDLEIRESLRIATNLADAFLLGYSGNTRAGYKRDLTKWFEFLEDLGVEPLEALRVHVDSFARVSSEIEGCSPSTVARRLSALAGYYKYGIDEELIARNPVSSIKRPKVGSESTSTGLDSGEVTALLAAGLKDGARTNSLILLLSLNGLRVSEALGTRVEDISIERAHHVIKIIRKGGRTAVVPLAPRTYDAIIKYLGDRSTGPIFITNSGKPIDRAYVWRLLRRLAKSSIPQKASSIHPHDLRHAFVTLSLDAGASLRHVQDAAGHADPRTTRRYDRARNNLDKHPTYALASLV